MTFETPRPADSGDLIVARATAPGAAAIAVVRLDGPGCREAAEQVVQCPMPEPRRLTRAGVHDTEGRAIDDVLLAWFPGPNSYTGNDLAEFHCHGSPAVVAAVIDALRAAGARLARPGEFTERAFFNGRMDLAQAEGVANLIASRTEAAGRLALSQLEGVLSAEVGAIRETLVNVAAEIEARIDFPEEDIEPEVRERLETGFARAVADVERLIGTARRGRLFRDGARVVLAGRPNTGKSSLFNALVGMERALVTPHPGTTRDTVEATLEIGGMPVTLVDTAGVRREGVEEVESLGIARALKETERADLAILVVDGSQPVQTADREIARVVRERTVVVAANKMDLGSDQEDEVLRASLRLDAGVPVLRLSALRRDTLTRLENWLEAALLQGEAETSESAVVINQRHDDALRTALDALRRGSEAFGTGVSGELVMVDLNEALEALGSIIGLEVGEDVLSRIFSRFCIGK